MISSFVEVWSSVTTYLTSVFPDIIQLFYTPAAGDTPGALTFVGVMAVVMAGISLILLVFNLIRSFFAMRG